MSDSPSRIPLPIIQVIQVAIFMETGLSINAGTLLDGAKFMENPKIWMIWELPAASQACHRGCRQLGLRGVELWDEITSVSWDMGGPKEAMVFTITIITHRNFASDPMKCPMISLLLAHQQ